MEIKIIRTIDASPSVEKKIWKDYKNKVGFQALVKKYNLRPHELTTILNKYDKNY